MFLRIALQNLKVWTKRWQSPLSFPQTNWRKVTQWSKGNLFTAPLMTLIANHLSGRAGPRGPSIHNEIPTGPILCESCTDNCSHSELSWPALLNVSTVITLCDEMIYFTHFQSFRDFFWSEALLAVYICTIESRVLMARQNTKARFTLKTTGAKCIVTWEFRT